MGEIGRVAESIHHLFVAAKIDYSSFFFFVAVIYAKLFPIFGTHKVIS